MNPWLRTVGSFGLIPLALTTLPAVRRHILKKYVTNVVRDEAIAKWRTRYELPDPKFHPDQLSQRLSDERVLQLTGRSGIGKTSYLTFLAAFYAEQMYVRSHASAGNAIGGVAKQASLKRVIPVFIPLVRYRGQKVEDMFAAQLASYGRVTDKALAVWYMQQGSFLLLLDGLNEVDENTRNEVNRAIDEGRRRNYFCVSSQEPYPPFGWVSEVKLSYLGPSSIENIVRSRLDEVRAGHVLNQFAKETYLLYRIPQDLQFLLDMVEADGNMHVPQSKAQLYESVLAPVFTTWAEEGRGDFLDTLILRAYEMVLSKDPAFNGKGEEIVAEFVNPLVMRKLMVQREKTFYFQHNLIRDYLGSRWLKERWRETFVNDGISLDSNWLEMLKFILDEVDGSETCNEFVTMVMTKNRLVAGTLFNWLESFRPALTAGWARDFKVKYADSVMGVMKQ
jgi:hypothetical protein